MRVLAVDGTAHARRGRPAPSGWVARGQRLVESHALDGPSHGFLLLPSAFQALFGGGGPAAAYAIFEQATAIGEQTGERDLIALGRHGMGQSLIMRGDVASGVGLLDEVMTAVTAGEVGPVAERDHLLRGHRDLSRDLRPRVGPASGPPRSVRGARPSPSWCPTAASAWCTGPK